MRLAKSTGRTKSPKIRHLGTVAKLCRAIFATNVHIDNRKKNLLESNISPTRPHNMVIFGPLAAATGSIVWGTQANFNGFRVLASLLRGIRAVDVSQTLRHFWNRGRQLYSAGRPSRWALAHILVFTDSLLFNYSVIKCR